MNLKPGQLVMLIGNDSDSMPPFGAIGEVKSWDGVDYVVDFPRYPCVVSPTKTWWCLPNWLMPINPGDNLDFRDGMTKYLPELHILI